MEKNINTLIEGANLTPESTALALTACEELGEEFISFAVLQALESNAFPKSEMALDVIVPTIVLGLCNDTDLLRNTIGLYAVESGAPKDVVQSMLSVESDFASVAMLTSLAKMVA